MTRTLVIAPAVESLQNLSRYEHDLIASLERLRRLEHDVYLLTSRLPWQHTDDVDAFYKSLDVPATVIQGENPRPGVRRLFERGTPNNTPAADNGSSYLHTLDLLMNDWPPDLVWCHGSQLWAVAERARGRNLPTVVRSLGDLGEDQPRKRIARAATVFAAATPTEQRLHKKPISDMHWLPLQSFAQTLRPSRPPFPARPLRIFYVCPPTQPAVYLDALRLLAETIAPQVRAAAAGAFVFHVQGKPPTGFAAAPDILFQNEIANLESFLADMDVAVVPPMPSHEIDMQALEVLCRAFPAVMPRSALGGYSFVDGISVLIAGSDNDYARQIVRLRDPLLRARLSKGAAAQAARLFSAAQLDERVQQIVATALN
ncbi:MAG: glycosyltransferase [Anaerolineae bacterium]|nr:glycosyltransferase [Anaerolineae bacterium]